MKKVIAMVVLVALLVSGGTFVYADEGPAKKLGRGLANIVTSPLEIFKGIGDAKDESGVFAAVTWGVIVGLVKTVRRIGVGAYETVTFPIALPADFEPILTDPEFFLDNK